MKQFFTKKRLIALGLALLLVVVLVGAGYLLIPRPTTRWAFQPESLFSMTFAPLQSNGLIYALFSSPDINLNMIYALDAHSGQVRWTSGIEGFIGDAPLAANGLLYVLSSNLDENQDTLHALDAATGRERWTFQQVIFGPPAIGNGIVYLHAANGTLYALDALSGEQLWSASVGNSAYAAPVVANNLVYLAINQEQGPTVIALDAATGAPKWASQEKLPTIFQLVVANGLVYLSTITFDAEVWVLDAFSGKLRWSTQFANINFVASSLQVVNGIVCLNFPAIGPNGLDPGAAKLYALDASTGQQLWTAPNISPEPAIADGMVYVYPNQSTLSALDARSGRQRWSHQAAPLEEPLSIQPDPSVVNGTVYVHTVANSTDTLYALQAASGSEQWSYQIGGYFETPLTVAQGLVYSDVSADSLDYEDVTAIQPPGGAPGFSH